MIKLPPHENSISNFLKGFSISVWEGIKQSKFKGRIEERFTIKLIDEILPYLINSGFKIKIFNATNEKVNGNDIEIWLEIEDNKFVCFPTQAKRVYEDFKYDAISLDSQQINSLTEYAKKYSGHPLYLFYNYYEKIEELDNSKNYEIYDFGCTLVCAYEVKSIVEQSKTPEFTDFHPNNFQPLYKIAELAENKITYEEFISNFKELNELNELKRYDYDDIVRDETWKEKSTPISRFVSYFFSVFGIYYAIKHFLKYFYFEVKLEQLALPVYTPKHRIFFSKSK